jgi:hypothetical protein
LDRVLFWLSSHSCYLFSIRIDAFAAAALVGQTTSQESAAGSSDGRVVPDNWAHGHNHVLLAFRLYYKSDVLDPDFPPPVLPHPLNVPQERPKGNASHEVVLRSPKAAAARLPPPPAPTPIDPLEARRKILSEVKEHLDLLKEFEGVISDDDLAQRKRELFRALPPAPPAAKRAKGDATEVVV